VRRGRRQWNERHGNCRRKRRARHAGNEFGLDAPPFERPQQERQTGKIREWITDYAER